MGVIFLLHGELLIVGIIGVVFWRVERGCVGSLSVGVLWGVGGAAFTVDGWRCSTRIGLVMFVLGTRWSPGKVGGVGSLR